MKRLLVITYYWPPSGGAGVQRWLKFTRYLRQFGWEPVIYTPENPEYPEIDESLLRDVPDGVEVIRTKIREPYRAYKRFIGRSGNERIAAGFLTERKKPGLAEKLAVWIRGNLFIPDARKFWIRPSVRHLSAYLREHPVDALATTGPPHSCHLIGLGLKEKTGLPWVADFRDPWTRIDFYHDLRLTGPADRKHKRLELAVLSRADRAIMISPSQAALFHAILPRTYDVITNGFDPADYPPEAAEEPEDAFSLAHIGSLVPARNPVILWKVLQELCAELPGFRDDLLIRLVGKVDYRVMESLESCGLTDRVERTGYLPHPETVRLQYRSRILLLLINRTPNAASILTGKFFEYLASSRPVLCIGPPEGDAADILRETGAGVVADFDDGNTLKTQIRNYYQQYREGKLTVRPTGTQAYSRLELTRKLAGILDKLVP